MATAKKEINNEMAIFNNEGNVPAYMNQGGERGSEDVTVEDLTIPRLEIVQALSPAGNKKEAEYIKGAEQGMLYNNVSRELYGENVYIVPVMFKKQWLIWRDRKSGGGFRGAFDTQEEASLKVQELVAEGDSAMMDINDTAQNICLLVKLDAKGQVASCDEIAISMSKSKMKISRQWNSMIRMVGGDRFSRVYQISAVQQQNTDGDKYYNYHVAPMGFTPEDVYKAAEKLFLEISSGSKGFNINQDQDEGSETAPTEGPQGEF